jgi:penicillin G amidase
METPKSGFLSSAFSALLRPFIRRLDKASSPKYDGIVSVPGLRNQVKICWQSHGIPHVFADNEADLFLAQGYLHAQERLWQMEMSRRFLSGRLAEIFGNFPVPWKESTSHFRGRETVDFDYFMRLMGIRAASAASLELSSEEERQKFDAYADGVNRYIEECGKKLPWEFRFLRYQPEPWRPEDSLTIGKGFAFLLSTALFTRLNMIALAARLNDQPEKLRSLFPSYPEDGPAITRASRESTRGLWHFANATFAGAGFYPAGHGSNNWVIAPHRSSTGNAILCNDPHLRMTLPPIWYLMHLRAEPNPPQADAYEVWGATIPGIPCAQLGHNRWIAWGVTAAICDDAELYREKIHPLEPDRYLVGHEWRAMGTRVEQIRIRGQREVEKKIRSTCHGPVISDFDFSPRAEALSLRWTAHDPGHEFRCLYGVNRARNWNDFLDSLAFQIAPTLNYVFADCEGNIGYSLAGRVPIRPSVPSLLPQDGWNANNEWRGWVPFSELPRLYNPPEGIIATANNRIADASYPYYLSHFFDPPYRIRRIKELLTAKQTHSMNDMAAIQLDLISLHARELIDNLRADLGQVAENDPALRAAADSLLGWDGKCNEDSLPSVVFHVFHHRLMENLLLPTLGEELFTAYVEILNQCVVPTDQILKDSTSPWFAAESRSRLVARSLRETCAALTQELGDDVAGWRWGNIHQLGMRHSLGLIKLLRPMLSVGPFPSPGDGTTINVGFYRHSNPYEHTIGASLRYIIDVKDSRSSGFILPSGQSGHIFSPHLKDQTELWRNGRRISLARAGTETRWESCLVLEPARSVA